MAKGASSHSCSTFARAAGGLQERREARDGWEASVPAPFAHEPCDGRRRQARQEGNDTVVHSLDGNSGSLHVLERRLGKRRGAQLRRLARTALQLSTRDVESSASLTIPCFFRSSGNAFTSTLQVRFVFMGEGKGRHRLSSSMIPGWRFLIGGAVNFAGERTLCCVATEMI